MTDNQSAPMTATARHELAEKLENDLRLYAFDAVPKFHIHLAIDALRAASPRLAGREEIARIIDPHAIDLYAQVLASGRKAENGKMWADAAYAAGRNIALAKADAILSLLGPAHSWQPIESAPKDGTEIIGLFWRQYDEGEKPTIYGPWTVAFERGSWRSSWDHSEVIEYMSDFGTDYKSPDIEPTLWQPLPAPPTSHASQDRAADENVGGKS